MRQPLGGIEYSASRIEPIVPNTRSKLLYATPPRVADVRLPIDPAPHPSNGRVTYNATERHISSLLLG